MEPLSLAFATILAALTCLTLIVLARSGMDSEIETSWRDLFNFRISVKRRDQD